MNADGHAVHEAKRHIRILEARLAEDEETILNLVRQLIENQELMTGQQEELINSVNALGDHFNRVAVILNSLLRPPMPPASPPRPPQSPKPTAKSDVVKLPPPAGAVAETAGKTDDQITGGTDNAS